MIEPYYRDDLVTLHHGDCIAVLRELPDNSVDAVVTDPPYGLEFMGKDWDAPWKQADTASSNATAGMSTTGYTDGAERLERPSYLGGLNPKCRNCDRWQRGANPCDCDTPDFPNERGIRGNAFQTWCTEWATECLRVLKPGGHILAFGGSRTWHRLAAAVEDAGFEIRDSIAWLYGSGFPKSMDVSKAIAATQAGYGGNSGAIRRATMGDAYEESGRRGNRDGAGRRDTGLNEHDLPLGEAAQQWAGWGTALKPAFEPIVVGRKPLAGTVAANVHVHGTGALNIDACRVPFADDADEAESKTKNQHGDFGSTAGGNQVYGDFSMVERENYDATGRWPTNVLLDEHQAAELDRQSGTTTSRIGKPRGAAAGDGWGMTKTGAEYDDHGGASRFFPTFRYQAKAPGHERPNVDGVQHPTVKPLDLMRWLVRLVTPPGATVLEPFAGSGTTAEACVLEDRQCIAIEREADYLPLIVSRLRKPQQQCLFGIEEAS